MKAEIDSTCLVAICGWSIATDTGQWSNYVVYNFEDLNDEAAVETCVVGKAVIHSKR